jgi:hypothetical protein
MLDQLLIPVVETLKVLVSHPAAQGLIVASVTEAVKVSPVGPSGGPKVRILAAVLAVATQLAVAASNGDITQFNQEEVGKHLIDALTCLLTAVGAWQLARKKAE